MIMMGGVFSENMGSGPGRAERENIVPTVAIMEGGGIVILENTVTHYDLS